MPRRKPEPVRILGHMETRTVCGTIADVLAQIAGEHIPLHANFAVEQDYCDYNVVLEWPVYSDDVPVRTL